MAKKHPLIEEGFKQESRYTATAPPYLLKSATVKAMKKLTLFTDGSVSPQTKIGYGAYLLLGEDKSSIKVKYFENTSSSKLELETLLWALHDIEDASSYEITVYTDSQSIVGLDARRSKILKNTTLKNYALYKGYFQITDTLNLSIIKVSGHLKSSLKNETDQYFAMVDKAARHALRSHNHMSNVWLRIVSAKDTLLRQHKTVVIVHGLGHYYDNTDIVDFIMTGKPF